MANVYGEQHLVGGTRHRADEIGVHHRHWWESSGLVLAVVAAIVLGLIAFWAFRRSSLGAPDMRSSVTSPERSNIEEPGAPMAASPALGAMGRTVCEQVTILFDSNAGSLGDEDMDSLQPLADCLKQNPSQVVRLEGRADPSELSRDAELSATRASSVATELTSLGVPASQIRLLNREAACSEFDESCWPQDHTVTIVPLPVP